MALVEELGKTGLFPTGRDAETVVGRLAESGWIVDAAVGDGEVGAAGDNGKITGGKGGSAGGNSGDRAGHNAADMGEHTGSDGANEGDRNSGNGSGSGGGGKAPPAPERKGRRFRCESCPAGPFDEYEVGFGGKRLLDYHSGSGHRIEWVGQ